MADTVPMTPAVTTADASPGLLPARMLNEFAYCPRMCYLDWVQGEFAESVDTFRLWPVPGGGGNQVTGDE
jgi:hypothetical protein